MTVCRYEAYRAVSLEPGDRVETTKDREGVVRLIRGQKVYVTMNDTGDVETYSSGILTYVPSQQEINDRSAAVRSNWTSKTEWDRRAVRNPEVEIPIAIGFAIDESALAG